MRLKSLIVAAGAVGMLLSPLPALAQAREDVAGGLFSARSLSAILPFLGAGAVIGGILIATNGDSNDSTVTPVSP